MKNLKTNLLVSLILMITLWSCTPSGETQKSTEVAEDLRTTIEMVTDQGTITIKLYDETPKHRDNFIKLANEGAFDSLLFHRVITGFMIQGGDPDSRNASPTDTLGNGGLPYKVDAEFHPDLYHKKGALAAARDGNLQRASASMQFYFVQGKVLNDRELTSSEARINEWLSEHFFKNDPDNSDLVEAVTKAQEERDFNRFFQLNDSIKAAARTYEKFERYQIPAEHREVYKTIGGTPALDQNYTVFGEIVEGLEVVDSIAKVETSPLDRPLEDVRIVSVRVLPAAKEK